MLRYELDQNSYLRMLEERDAHELYQAIDANRAHLRKWLPFVDSTRSEQDSLSFIRSARIQIAENKGMHCGIFLNDTLVGVIGYHFIDWNNRVTSIGYWLTEDAQGKGLMTRSVRALLENAFHNWQINRVEIRVATDNHKSQAIPKRLGFRQEGILRQREWLYDHYVDHILYALLKTEWKAVEH
jgi:ribosomal-protein-serine acetyltransferase